MFEIGGNQVNLGENKIIDLHLGRLYDYTELLLPMKVIRGKKEGPTLFISGAVHGDEIVGVEIVKRIINDKRLKNINGTLIAVPIVNIFGFNTKSRYLPDRRDLNRSFPGSSKGSLASRIAALFLKEVVKKSDYGIDFHSGALHRTNLPQIRTCLDTPGNKELAETFGVPVILDSKLRDGSLRQAAADNGVKMLLFEGGEALRIEERVVKYGVTGAFSIMEKIGMLPMKSHRKPTNTYHAKSSYWVRSPQSGLIRFQKNIGSNVKKNDVIGHVADSFGKNKIKITAPTEGIIIGISNIPLANRGDAIFHIATFTDAADIADLTEDLMDYNDLFGA